MILCWRDGTPAIDVKLYIMKKLLLLSLLLTACATESTQITSTPLIKTTKTWEGKPVTYPTNQAAEVTALMITIPVGAETGWHHHPVPSFAYIVEGSLDVTLKNGSVNHLTAGDPLVEVVETSHNGRNVGKVPVKIMVFYAGTINTPLTIKD